MDEIEFKIFTPVKTRRITPNVIVFALLLPSFTFAFLSEKIFESEFLEDLGLNGLFITGSLIVYYTFTKNFKREPLNGNLNKRLIFSSDWISIDGKKHSLNTFKKIDFTVYDYFNKWEYRRDFNPVRSNGTGNKLILTLLDGEIIELHFQLMHENQMKRLEEHLKHYYSIGILHFLKLIDLLGIDDYEDIQEFKKKLQQQTTEAQ